MPDDDECCFAALPCFLGEARRFHGTLQKSERPHESTFQLLKSGDLAPQLQQLAPSCSVQFACSLDLRAEHCHVCNPSRNEFFLVVLNYCPAAHHRSSSPSAVATRAGFIRDHGDTSRRRGSRRIGGMRVRYMSGSTRKEASIGTGDSGKTVDALHALCSGLCA